MARGPPPELAAGPIDEDHDMLRRATHGHDVAPGPTGPGDADAPFAEPRAVTGAATAASDGSQMRRTDENWGPARRGSLPGARARREGRAAALRMAVAAAFAAAGSAKLFYAPLTVLILAAFGGDYWLPLLAGSLEIAGAVLLLIPATAAIGAGLLALLALSAAASHLALSGGSALLALAYLTLLALLALDRRLS